MLKNKKWFLLSGILIGMLSMVGGYQYIYRHKVPETKQLDHKEARDKVKIPNQNPTKSFGNEKVEMEDESIVSEEVTIQSSEKVLPSTKLVYQYYYTLDQKMIEEELDPPYYLLNMTREQLQEKLSDWDLQLFSDKKIVLQKIVEEKSPYNYYLLGVYDSYVAVFYDTHGEWILREVTSTPISALPLEEQKKLEEGIMVYGDEALINLLEDYTS
ncbi:MAG: hypothetical protein GX962_02670 [Epulopiscium sp.]|nr:hypothetical protein [Candidatus Epulonipiscium sp.]